MRALWYVSVTRDRPIQAHRGLSGDAYAASTHEQSDVGTPTNGCYRRYSGRDADIPPLPLLDPERTWPAQSSRLLRRRVRCRATPILHRIYRLGYRLL